ncbi:MAG TPA: hypothetical protein VKF81_02355 [Blastocatellia bacterium]|nr:hypothetical protein [Blastocatellia bacterium]
MAAQRVSKSTMLVNVKLAPHADRKSLVNSLSTTPGILNVTQTFPDETDRELSGLFLLEIDSAELSGALKKLRQDPSIEYAEEAAPRKLIR